MSTNPITNHHHNPPSNLKQQPSSAETELDDSIQILSSTWMAGPKKNYPTFNLPPALAKQFGLDQPCKILIQGRKSENGILIKYFSSL